MPSTSSIRHGFFHCRSPPPLGTSLASPRAGLQWPVPSRGEGANSSAGALGRRVNPGQIALDRRIAVSSRLGVQRKQEKLIEWSRREICWAKAQQKLRQSVIQPFLGEQRSGNSSLIGGKALPPNGGPRRVSGFPMWKGTYGQYTGSPTSSTLSVSRNKKKAPAVRMRGRR